MESVHLLVALAIDPQLVDQIGEGRVGCVVIGQCLHVWTEHLLHYPWRSPQVTETDQELLLFFSPLAKRAFFKSLVSTGFFAHCVNSILQ